MKRNALLVIALAVLAGGTFIAGAYVQDMASGKGILEGRIDIGPLCPVETNPPDPACEPTEETFRAWSVAIWTQGKTAKIAQLMPDAGGSYMIELPAGSYVADFEGQRPGIGAGSLPATISIRSGEATTLDITIDTGIR